MKGASEDSQPTTQSTSCIYKDSKNQGDGEATKFRERVERTKYMTRSEQARGRWLLAASLELKSYLLKKIIIIRERFFLSLDKVPSRHQAWEHATNCKRQSPLESKTDYKTFVYKVLQKDRSSKIT